MEHRLTLHPPELKSDLLRLSASLDDLTLWWTVPARWQHAITSHADPFVIAFLFPIMQLGEPVVIDAPVSRSLLANLELFMAIWSAWVPAKYRPAPLRAAAECPPPPPAAPDHAVLPFSSGMDSAFSALRHSRQLVGRRSRKIAAGIVMHGFDIWLDETNANSMYAGLLRRSEAMLASLDIPCVPIASNFHQLPTIWAHSHGTHLASGLHLFARGFGHGLIANSIDCHRLTNLWGSHPLTDPLLSSNSFAILDDGSEVTRIEKAQLLSTWPAALAHLRVCYENPGSHENCCACEKCVRRILQFRIAADSLPPAFKRDVSDSQIRRLKLTTDVAFDNWITLLRDARHRLAQSPGQPEPSWVRAVRTLLARNRRRRAMARFNTPFVPLRNALRQLFRGSPQSRAQLKRNPPAH